jgi:hypothetical protein
LFGTPDCKKAVHRRRDYGSAVFAANIAEAE